MPRNEASSDPIVMHLIEVYAIFIPNDLKNLESFVHLHDPLKQSSTK
jgi:hypothetical protein